MSVAAALDRFTRRQRGLITRCPGVVRAGSAPAQIRTRLENGASGSRSGPSVYACRGRSTVVGAEPASRVLAYRRAELRVARKRPLTLADWRGAEQPGRNRGRARPSNPKSASTGCRGHRSGYPVRCGLHREFAASRPSPPNDAPRARGRCSRARARQDARRCNTEATSSDLESFRRCAQRLTPGPVARSVACRKVLAERLPGYSPGESDLETRALRALVSAGLPPPRQQYRMNWLERRYASTSPIRNRGSRSSSTRGSSMATATAPHSTSTRRDSTTCS